MTVRALPVRDLNCSLFWMARTASMPVLVAPSSSITSCSEQPTCLAISRPSVVLPPPEPPVRRKARPRFFPSADWIDCTTSSWPITSSQDLGRYLSVNSVLTPQVLYPDVPPTLLCL